MFVVQEAVMFSADSLFAGMIVSPWVKGWGARTALSALFGACDALASLGSGYLSADAVILPVILALLLAAPFLFCMVRSAIQEDAGPWITRAIACLPLMLCIDNLTSPMAGQQAALTGAVSAAAAFLGLGAVAFVRPSMARPDRLWFVGAALPILILAF